LCLLRLAWGGDVDEEDNFYKEEENSEETKNISGEEEKDEENSVKFKWTVNKSLETNINECLSYLERTSSPSTISIYFYHVCELVMKFPSVDSAVSSSSSLYTSMNIIPPVPLPDVVVPLPHRTCYLAELLSAMYEQHGGEQPVLKDYLKWIYRAAYHDSLGYLPPVLKRNDIEQSRKYELKDDGEESNNYKHPCERSFAFKCRSRLERCLGALVDANKITVEEKNSIVQVMESEYDLATKYEAKKKWVETYIAPRLVLKEKERRKELEKQREIERALELEEAEGVFENDEKENELERQITQKQAEMNKKMEDEIEREIAEKQAELSKRMEEEQLEGEGKDKEKNEGVCKENEPQIQEEENQEENQEEEQEDGKKVKRKREENMDEGEEEEDESNKRNREDE
jgi:hypothetical protein